jgi:hypothetical protein
LIPGFGSIDHEIFSDFFTTFGPLQTPFVLPVSTHSNTDTNSGSDGNEGNVRYGDSNQHKNNDENENERYRVTIKTINDNNSHTLLLVKFVISMSIILVCFVLLLILARRMFLKWRNKNSLGTYQHLYVDVKIGENNNHNDNNNIHNNHNSTESSKFLNQGTSYGSIKIGDINSREKYFIQSDRKIVAGVKKNKV